MTGNNNFVVTESSFIFEIDQIFYHCLALTFWNFFVSSTLSNFFSSATFSACYKIYEILSTWLVWKLEISDKKFQTKKFCNHLQAITLYMTHMTTPIVSFLSLIMVLRMPSLYRPFLRSRKKFGLASGVSIFLFFLGFGAILTIQKNHKKIFSAQKYIIQSNYELIKN